MSQNPMDARDEEKDEMEKILSPSSFRRLDIRSASPDRSSERD
jgi:hypothetical protein